MQVNLRVNLVLRLTNTITYSSSWTSVLEKDLSPLGLTALPLDVRKGWAFPASYS